MPTDDLAARLLAGERAAVSDALNLVDDSRPRQQADARELLDQLDGRGDSALRVGITGAPGSGKSTLIDALVREIRSRDQSVGIIAVDPSSRSTGGALLGDRLRMRSSATDTGVFMRSMAARDRLGGLADATRAGTEILAVVFDWVFIETVGVGQSESEVSHLVDTLVFVAHPSAGDTLQFMKAGILELPDLFIVNKADIGPRALRTANELQAGLGLGTARDDGWLAPVLLTSARDGDGVPELVASMQAHREHLDTTGVLAQRRRKGRMAYVMESLERTYGSYGMEAVGGRAALEQRILASDSPTGALLARLGQEIETRLSEQPA